MNSHQTVTLVEKLLKLGLNQDDIGIITPYSIQLRALKKFHRETPNIKVGTVEDFQGKFNCLMALFSVHMYHKIFFIFHA